MTPATPAAAFAAAFVGALAPLRALAPGRTCARALALGIVLLHLIARTASGQQVGETVQITLSNGDVLTAVVVSWAPDLVVVDHALLGRVLIAPAAITSTAAPGAPPPAAAAAPITLTTAEPAAEEPSPWSGIVDLGGDVNTGNTDTSDFRAAVETRRKDEMTQLDLSFAYRYKTEDEATTEDNRLLGVRHQWLDPGTAWRTFLEGSFEQDRFKDFDSRIRVGAGRAYAFHDTPETQMIGRAGLGAVQEDGGPDEHVMLEGILGFDYEQQIAERQRFISGVSLYPSLDEVGEYQAKGRAIWELQVSETEPWALRLGIESEYDSEPGDASSTDLHYFASLGYRF